MCSPETPTVNDFNHETLYNATGSGGAPADLVWTGESTAADGTVAAVRASSNSAGVAPGVWTKSPVENPCNCRDGRSWWQHSNGDGLKFMDDGKSSYGYPPRLRAHCKEATR